ELCSIKVWDPSTLSEPLVALCANGRIKCFRFYPQDNTVLASCDEDNWLDVWDLVEQKQLRRLDLRDTNRGEYDWINSFSFSRDGTKMVTLCRNYCVQVWNTND